MAERAPRDRLLECVRKQLRVDDEDWLLHVGDTGTSLQVED